MIRYLDMILIDQDDGVRLAITAITHAIRFAVAACRFAVAVWGSVEPMARAAVDAARATWRAEGGVA